MEFQKERHTRQIEQDFMVLRMSESEASTVVAIMKILADEKKQFSAPGIQILASPVVKKFAEGVLELAKDRVTAATLAALSEEPIQLEPKENPFAGDKS